MKQFLPFAIIATATALDAGDSPKDFSESDFDTPTYQMSDGYAIIEAESLPLSDNWEMRKDPSAPNKGCGGELPPNAYTGTGYMRYTGPTLTCASQGFPEGENHNDITQSCQGDKAHWMVFKVFVPEAGEYAVRPRIYHQERDGDNDYWCHVIGQEGTIKREADCVTHNYTWPTWGPHRFQLEQGVNAIYIGGRSNGIGIDRIVVYAAESEETALDVGNPESPKYVPADS